MIEDLYKNLVSEKKIITTENSANSVRLLSLFKEFQPSW